MERKTEIIVRNHFYKFLNLIEVEEQKSENLKINKLLKTASKKGSGPGYPEFIITYKANSDFIIVIECKAQIKKHESSNKDQYSEYAVDGVLLYSSYLSKDFDVLSIAVSGINQKNLKVSHFLQLKGKKQAVQKFGDKLLSVNDYLNGYLKSSEKFQQDYLTLLDFAKKLNKKLHTYKILESQRSLLISGILIALGDAAFKSSYGFQKTPQNLAISLMQTILNELKNTNHQLLENLEIQFGFIKTDTSLSTKQGVLKELIDEIDENINKFIKTYEYFDVLGQLYIEFLRYANSDKGLGIVLTPPHINEFFSDLAQVNKNSIILDNCTGTGGLLVSAMKKMISHAQGDSEKIKQIQSKQLIGIEYQSHIFALAISNMYIHQNRKTNIINGDCFDENIIEKIKNLKPTIGFLNPPYKSDKKQDIDELEFVLNNLECLVDGGTCIAIVPMQRVLAQKGKVFELKKKLLEKHTLEAVFSMPDELFFNSKVSVVSCIIVLTAHRPHPQSKQTYFGYYKNDGFVKRKIQGRFDAFDRWYTIKQKWLANFFNKKVLPASPLTGSGSISQKVTAKDEWCAEAYMVTNYTLLTKKHFEDFLLHYSSFLFSNKLTEKVSTESFNQQNNVEFSTENWKLFKLDNLFEITGSQTTSILELEKYEDGQYPYVTAQTTNNGTYKFCDFYTEEGNILTVELILSYCFYQPKNFSASGNILKLIPKFAMNKYIALFLVTILNLENYRYNYGRTATQTRLKNIFIKLPERNGKPNFEFMETFIKSLSYSCNL
uniref:site-specific DNA-methyltransferase (adenine-specific) n=1 Tax=Halimeda discoidea TaxID=118222 RepID=A0A1C9JB10_9CHLO|nr:hypothetical protein [Halimeda discoidea]